MEERKFSGLPFHILSARNYAKFHSTEFLVAVLYAMVDPVHTLADIITSIGRRNNYTGNTIVTFSFKDDNGRSVFLNRVDGKPLILQELYDGDAEILSKLFSIICNSNEDWEFGAESRITILYTRCPYEANITIPEGLPNPTRPRKFPEFNRQFGQNKNCK